MIVRVCPIAEHLALAWEHYDVKDLQEDFDIVLVQRNLGLEVGLEVGRVFVWVGSGSF